ncbi:MAG: four helix bundle protein [Elusimicrobiota bacterium]|nr:four helix bundle protein [Elusimicrobiota bacterium]
MQGIGKVKTMYKSFKEMPVWQKAMDVATETFKLTENLPKKEDYGFTSQIRRSTLSISANIAEAYGRHHNRDKINFYYFSRGSVTETQSHLEYGRKVGYLKNESTIDLEKTLMEIYQSLNKLIIKFDS